MRHQFAVSIAAPLLWMGSVSSPAIAQNAPSVMRTFANPELHRAKNYARQAAEQTNGGLNKYRAESTMHGPAEATNHVKNPDGSFTFTFTGTVFGATRAEDRIIESVVTVTPQREVSVVYNGPVRNP